MRLGQELKRLARHSVIYGLGGLVSRILAVLLLPLYTHYLPPGSYGRVETLTAASALLKRKGAKRIVACVSHAILNEVGIERLRKSAIDELITTDTVFRPAISGVKVTTLSVAGLLGEAIKRIHSNSSVTSLFEFKGGRTS